VFSSTPGLQISSIADAHKPICGEARDGAVTVHDRK
jgi:hypothetical protein